MSLRLKIILALTAIAALATVAIGVASYTATQHELEETVERSLQAAARAIADRPSIGEGDDALGAGLPGAGGPRPGRDRPRSFEQVLVQAIAADGTVVVLPNSGALPVNDADVEVATSTDPAARAWSEVEIDGEPFRMLTVKYGDDSAVQLARSLRESQHALERIQTSTLVAVLLVTIVTLVLGWLIARQVTRRLERLTDVAGEVADTGRLDVEVPVDGTDETGQLGRAFRGMLDALQRSKHEQGQLVQDAGHELRTPLTSLRTNISVLRRFDSLPPESREQLLTDLDRETRELTDLVNELVELATDGRDEELVQPVRLADVAERAAARGRRRFNREVLVDADDSLLDARPNALERALQNLVDNACKFAPDGPVEVTVLRGLVVVRDHGPGLVVADIPYLFDRFYRSVEMRSKPGSGLGLSIVKSVVDVHGGQVFARNAEGGGAEIGFVLPLPVGD